MPPTRLADVGAAAILTHPGAVFGDFVSNAAQQPFDPPNILVGLLTAVLAAPVPVQPPFVQSQWDNPQKRAWVDTTWVQSPFVIPQRPDVQGTVFPPFRAELPDNTLREAWRDYSWTQSPFEIPPVVDIQSSDRILRQDDFPNPLRPWVRDLTWTQTPQTSLIPQVADIAVALKIERQSDWPNPILPWVRDLTWTQTPHISLIPAQPTPPVEVIYTPQTPSFTDYYGRPTQDFGWFVSPQEIPPQEAPPVVFVQPPFVQADWPNPRGKGFLKTTPFVNRLEPIEPTPGTPFFETEWPNPVRRISPKEWGWVQSANPALIPQPVAPPSPFYQTEHPNPLRPWARDLSWVQSAYIELIPTPPVVIPPVVVPEAGPRPSGGRVHPWITKPWRKKLPQEVAEIVEDLAKKQLEDLRLTQAAQREQLKSELRLAELEYKTRYFEALQRERELLIELEIGKLLHKEKTRREEEALFVLMSLI